MKRIVVLMYHALWSDTAELERIDPVDRPYALPLSEFVAQLDALAAQGIPVLDPAALEQGLPRGGGVVLTFDDGHASNARLALPQLLARGLRAAFFITTAHTDQHAGFCTSAQLRELAAAGMVVGAHGHTHRFLSDLDDTELHAEMRDSQRVLCAVLGAPARQMSFPGGRSDARCLGAARAAGFDVLYGSAVGALRPGSPLPSAALARIAIRPGLPPPMFAAYARAAAGPMVRSRALALAKALAKIALGNERYHGLYARLRS